MQSFLIHELASGNGFLFSLTIQILLLMLLICWPHLPDRYLPIPRRWLVRRTLRMALLLFGLLPAFWAMPVFPGWAPLQAVSLSTFLFLNAGPRRRHSPIRNTAAIISLIISLAGWGTEVVRWGGDRIATSHPDPEGLPTTVPKLSVLVVGDSLSAGIRERSGESWPDILRAKTGWTVINDSQAADTSGEVADRWQRSLPPALSVLPQPRVAVVLLGGNDMLNGRSPRLMEQDLERILERLQADRFRILLVELPLLPLGSNYGLAQSRLAEKYGVRLLPRRQLARVLATPGATHDGLHLSPSGATHLAQEMLEEILFSFTIR